MPSEPLILGFDTSAAHCAAALLCGDQIIAERLEPMSRGQAERLMVLLEEILAEGDASWSDLTAIGVGVGPGNFTGIRIGVSAARGLALGLEIPAVGVTGFDARAVADDLPAIPAPRDQVYAALPGQAPRLMPASEAADAARGAGLTFAPEASPPGIAAAIARITALRFEQVTQAPAPLYMRAADAAPSRDIPPALIDG